MPEVTHYLSIRAGDHCPKELLGHKSFEGLSALFVLPTVCA